MFMIAIELHLAFDLPFMLTWLTCAIGEFVVYGDWYACNVLD